MSKEGQLCINGIAFHVNEIHDQHKQQLMAPAVVAFYTLSFIERRFCALPYQYTHTHTHTHTACNDVNGLCVSITCISIIVYCHDCVCVTH